MQFVSLHSTRTRGLPFCGPEERESMEPVLALEGSEPRHGEMRWLAFVDVSKTASKET